MLTGISKFCALNLFKRGAIGEKNINDVRFGLEVFITHLITFASILVIGIMINHLTETVLFCVIFCHLRSFSNGFHAKTFIQCFMLSNITFLFVLIAQNYIFEYILIMILIILSSAKLVYHYKSKKTYIIENKFFILYLFISMLINQSLILCTLIVVLFFDKGEILCQEKELIQIKN